MQRQCLVETYSEFQDGGRRALKQGWGPSKQGALCNFMSDTPWPQPCPHHHHHPPSDTLHPFLQPAHWNTEASFGDGAVPMHSSSHCRGAGFEHIFLAFPLTELTVFKEPLWNIKAAPVIPPCMGRGKKWEEYLTSYFYWYIHEEITCMVTK